MILFFSFIFSQPNIYSLQFYFPRYAILSAKTAKFADEY